MAASQGKFNLDPFRLWAVLVALLCMGLIGRMDRFELGADMEVLLSGDQRSLEGYESVNSRIAQLEEDLVFVLVVVEFDDVFAPEAITRLREISAACMDNPNVYHALSLVHPPFRPVVAPLSVPPLKMEPLIAGLSATELETARRYCKDRLPLLQNFLVTPDNRRALMWLMCEADVSTAESNKKYVESIDATLAPFAQQGQRFQVLSFPHGEEEIRATLWADMWMFLPIAFVILLGVLLFTFRFSLWMLLAVLLGQAIGLAALPGLITLISDKANVFTVILFPLLSGLHLAMLIHVGTAYQRARNEGESAEDAVRAVFEKVFRSSAFAGLTTAAGLFSLMASEVPSVREFGIIGGMGMVLMFAITFGPALMLLRFLHAGRVPVAVQQRPRSLDYSRWLGRVRHWRPTIAVGTLLLVGAMVWGWSKVRTDIRATEFLEAESPTRQVVELCDRECGGINVLRIEIDSGQADGVGDAKFMEYLQRARAIAVAGEEVEVAYAFPWVLDQIYHAAVDDESKLVRAMAEKLVKPNMLRILSSDAFEEMLPLMDILFDEERRKTYLYVRTRFMPAEEYIAMIHTLMRELEEARSDATISVSATEGIHEILEADRVIVHSQLNTAGITCALVGLALVVIWRSLSLALIALFINVLPVGLVVALQGFAGVPLNAITIMVAAVAFGIAVDDTIHFITHWRMARARGLDGEAALRETMEVKCRPIVCTTVILAGILCVFAFSSFPPVVHFGLLLAAGLVGALGAALGLLPAWLGRDGRDTGK